MTIPDDDGKVVHLTDDGPGLGLAIARGFAAAGVRVAVPGCSVEALVSISSIAAHLWLSRFAA